VRDGKVAKSPTIIARRRREESRRPYLGGWREPRDVGPPPRAPASASRTMHATIVGSLWLRSAPARHGYTTMRLPSSPDRSAAR
jgi:hypothetical protein